MSRSRRAPAPLRSPFIVQATAEANAAIGGLRGRERSAYQTILAELAAHGCRAGGYRLLDADGGWSDFCCRHGYGSQRFILTFLAADEQNTPFAHLADPDRPTVLIVCVGRHSDGRFYRDLGDLGIGPVGHGREQKPDCCGGDGWPRVGEARARPRPAPRRLTI